METMKKYLFLLLLTSLLLSCGAEVTPTPAPTAVAVATTAPEPTDTPTAVPPTDTPIPPTTAAEPATVTPLPTNADVPTAELTATDPAAGITTTTEITPELALTIESSSTPGDGTPTAVAVAPPTGGVTQPPYQASSCSDKYPCNNDVEGWEARIQVPAGFSDSYFARVTGQPTSITFGPDGRLYVAVQEGSIYAIDQAGGISTYASGFNTPTGIAFQPGTSRLFVSSRVLNENVGGEAQVSVANGAQIVGGLPCCYTFLHAANGIAFGPDGMGYVSVGGRADHGEILDGSNRQDERHPLEASILRFSPNGGGV
jgi:glucose/arabinose dehydrogenase